MNLFTDLKISEFMLCDHFTSGVTDILIQNGTVVTPEQTAEMDIRVAEGRITGISASGSSPEDSERVIDASGQFVFPGCIDSHVHVELPLGEFTTLDDFGDATRAAAHGGTTTIIPFAIPEPEETPIDAYKRRRSTADGKVYTNYGLHACLTDVNKKSLSQLPDLIGRGAASVKMFMVYEDRLMVSDGEIRDALNVIEANNGIALIHAENESIIGHITEQKVQSGNTDFSDHPDMHPRISETTAMWTIADLVEETKCPTFFVHVSSKNAQTALSSAETRNLPLLAETCPHYLTLSEEVYEQENGNQFVCSPPVRSEEDHEKLWEMLSEGTIHTVNSDHCCYDIDQKEQYRNDITKMPMGLPGVETRNTVFYTDAVSANRLSVEAFVRLTSTNVAKMLGLYPQKGAILVGADADLVVFDPTAEWIIDEDDLHMKTDYSPFDGKSMKGRPTTTIIGGEIVVEENELVGDPNGEFVPTDGSAAGQTFRQGAF